MLLCALYAASDELHQAFIPGRSPQLADVLIDCGGALAGILLAALAVLLHRHCRKKAALRGGTDGAPPPPV